MVTRFSRFVFFLFTGIALGNRCHPGWTFYRGSCYGFGETFVSWGDAMTICKTYGAKLAEPNSILENTFIKDLAKDKGATHIWIGGNDIFHEGSWEWVSPRRNVYINGFSDWVDDQPDDTDDDEDCLTLLGWRDYDYKWNDDKCTDWKNFICQGEPLDTQGLQDLTT